MCTLDIHIPLERQVMLTKKEAQDIVDSLLFSCSCDICADWSTTRYISFGNLARKIATEFKITPSKDVFLFKSDGYEENHSEELEKNFPKLRVEKHE